MHKNIDFELKKQYKQHNLYSRSIYFTDYFAARRSTAKKFKEVF